MNESDAIYVANAFGDRFHVYGTPEEPIFKASEISRFLNYTTQQMAFIMNRLDAQDKLKIRFGYAHSSCENWFVRPAGIYKIASRLNTEGAKQFADKVKQVIEEIQTSNSDGQKSDGDCEEELIHVTYDNDRPVVSARDLHKMLEVQTAYKDWFPRMCEYGFTEGVDFNLLKNERVQMEGNRSVTRMVQDAAVTLDMAKEICMIQRTEKSKQVRQYFIQLEKDWNSPEKVMARALQIANKQIKELSAKNISLLAENEHQKQIIADFEPKRQYLDTILESTGTIATSQIAADYGLTAVALNNILRESGVQRKINGQWILCSNFMGNGYTDSKTFPIVRRNGAKDSVIHTYWTQKGRLMIHEILTKRGIVALMDRKDD